MEIDIPVGVQVLISLIAVCYFIFIVYLSIHLYIAMRGKSIDEHHPIIEKFVMVEMMPRSEGSSDQKMENVYSVN